MHIKMWYNVRDFFELVRLGVGRHSAQPQSPSISISIKAKNTAKRIISIENKKHHPPAAFCLQNGGTFSFFY